MVRRFKSEPVYFRMMTENIQKHQPFIGVVPGSVCRTILQIVRTEPASLCESIKEVEIDWSRTQDDFLGAKQNDIAIEREIISVQDNHLT